MSSTNGRAQSGFGKLESVAGDAIGDQDLQGDGAANEAEGRAKEAAGSAQKAIGEVAAKAQGAVKGAVDQVEQSYKAVGDKTRELKDKVDPLVQQKPYLALLGAFALGFLTSRLIAPGGPKVVYVKPRD